MNEKKINQDIYYAYGSNLNLRQMARRCPTAKLLGTGVIPDYELLFRGREVYHEGVSRGVLEGFWYVMNDDRRLPPSQEYWDAIVEGYHDMGFDVTLLEKALEK